MKILQINTVAEHSSTGRTCIELSDALHRHGDESYIAYGQGTTSYKNSFKIGKILENHIHNVGSRVCGKQGYFSKKGTENLVNYIKGIKPDVIHLRNLHGNYLNLEILFNYLAIANLPVVWSLHDCWAFTGKCTHYTDVGCYKWQTHCNNCPQVRKYPMSLFFDYSDEMFTDKKQWFTSVNNMTIVPVSKWLAEEVKKSFLSKYPVLAIHNWINRQVFKPTHGNFREKNGIDKDKFVILGVSAGWSAESIKLKNFIQLSKLVPDTMQIVLIGNAENIYTIPKSIIHVPYVNNTTELAGMYTMADVFVNLSVEDTFGKVIAEALGCGTPAIVYNTTAYPELIGEGCGYVVKKGDIDEVYKVLCKIAKKGKRAYSAQCIKSVEENFDFVKNTDKTIQLYRNILSG